MIDYAKNNAYPSEIYWIWLQSRLGIPSRCVSAVMDLDGSAKRVYESSSEELWRLGLFSRQTIDRLRDRDLTEARSMLQKCYELGYEIITPDSPNYPHRLRNIYDPPAVLYVSGALPDIDRHVCVSIVGTRSATAYGSNIAHELSGRLTEAGVLIISGCAKGIDTAAHNGALDHGGKTVAVLGCGIDFRYNMENHPLRIKISKNGAVISEYPPGTNSVASHFPIRNRIIAGLSLGTVVIEAGVRSGSLLTANMALEQGRDVFAVPSAVGMPNSDGVVALLRDGAKAVKCPLDVLSEYYAMYPHRLSLEDTERPLLSGRRSASQQIAECLKDPPDPSEPPADKRKKRSNTSSPSTAEVIPEKNTKPESTVVLPAFVSEGAARLYSLLQSEPIHIDLLAAQAQISAAEAMRFITELELSGCILSHPGRRYSAKISSV